MHISSYLLPLHGGNVFKDIVLSQDYITFVSFPQRDYKRRRERENESERERQRDRLRERER
jgi:hypothetical protein